jgi:uncharacterized membrane protein
MIAMYILLGITVGMRTMTAIAVLCWFAWSGMVPQTGWAFWTGYLVSAIIFTVLALGEYIGDTLPSTPSRTAPGPAIGRVVFGGLVGGLAAHGILEPTAGGVIFGVVGALIGTFGGVRLRLRGAKVLGRDLPVALFESALALGISLFICVKLHSFLAVMELVPRGRWML